MRFLLSNRLADTSCHHGRARFFAVKPRTFKGHTLLYKRGQRSSSEGHESAGHWTSHAQTVHSTHRAHPAHAHAIHPTYAVKGCGSSCGAGSRCRCLDLEPSRLIQKPLLLSSIISKDQEEKDAKKDQECLEPPPDLLHLLVLIFLRLVLLLRLHRGVLQSPNLRLPRLFRVLSTQRQDMSGLCEVQVTHSTTSRTR